MAVELVKRVFVHWLGVIGIRLPIRFGSLRRVTPIGRSFGIDRGKPIDRHYIELFLESYSGDIRGQVLEAGGYASYTALYGDKRVSRGDVLYPNSSHVDATVVGDLTTGEGIPLGIYDCLIMTQVYQFTYEVKSAIENSYHALRKGGVLLATLPGISQVSRYDRERWGDYWRFTTDSARELFCGVFGPGAVTIQAYGNVKIACAFLQGLATNDLPPEDFNYDDPDFEFLIVVRAVKNPRAS